MKNGRLALFSFLIFLPALLIVGLGTWLVLDNVPRAIRYEPRRQSNVYRETAERMLNDPLCFAFDGERKTGWVQRGKIDGVAWGFAPDGRDVCVWTATGPRTCRYVRVKRIHGFPYELVFYVGGGAVAVVLLALSAFAVVCFVRFVKSRDDFLAATAHDLMTPLVGMRMMIGRNDDEAKRLNERMLLIVSNIKGFLKLGGKRRQPDLKSVDIVALTKEAYELFAEDYEDSEGGAVTFQTSQTFQTFVMADEAMTLQILWNLFGNDLKYAAPYGKVAVRFVAEGNFIRVEFADEGQGMSPRQMKKAFDRYYRAKTVLESGKGGFGIGLCTAREFARQMGGDLTVHANVPHGCVFTLSLPVRP